MKKKNEEKELSKINEVKSDEVVDLLKQIIKQNSQVIDLLTKLKDRFV